VDFEETEEERMIAETSREIAGEFGPDYWREHEEEEKFGQEFWDTLVNNNFTGVIIPEEYGGEGMGMLELEIAMDEMASNGCGMAPIWYLCVQEVFCSNPISRLGTEEQKEKYLPKLAKGMEGCMALTEPDAGSNTLNTKTLAVEDDNGYIINGQKMFISNVDRSSMMLLVTRTTPKEEVKRKSEGLTLFLVDLPDESVSWEAMPKHGINYSHTCTVHIDDLIISEDSILGGNGRIGKGWQDLVEVLNPERISFGTAGVGIGTCALKYAVEYANTRDVFGDPIGSYQGLQFPMAASFAKLECARLMNRRAAWLLDHGKPYVADANLGKYMSVEAGMEACYNAMQALGGYGYAKEQHVERWWREMQLCRLAPVTNQMSLAYIGEHIMGMPKSFRTV